MLIQERPRLSPWKKCGVALLAGGTLAAGLVWFFGRESLARRYAAHREQKSLEQSQAFAARGDLESALLAVRAAAEANPGGIDTQRQAAALLEQAGAASAVTQREQVSQLAPASVPDRLAWAQAALRFQNLESAQRALAGFDEAQQQLPEVARLCSALALARRQPTPAREALALAVARNPADAQLGLELAALDLRGANPAGFEAAKKQLEAFASGGPHRQAARRELLLVTAARGGLDEAARWADLLADDPEAVFDDQIRRLNARQALLGWTSPETLKLAADRARTPADQARLADWLVLTGQPQRALDWLATLGAPAGEIPALVTARAGAAAALQKWPEVLDLVGRGAWGAISENALTLVRSSRLMQERQRSEVSRTLWQEALEVERHNPSGLHILHRLATLWNSPEFARLSLLDIARYSPDGDWAFQRLAADAFARKDTADLRAVWSLQVQVQPLNRSAANDWALASLLLSPDAPAQEVRRRIDELAQQEPDNPRFVLTRALALWRSRQAREALALLERLPDEQRRRPGAALYYGALLVANHRRAEAAPYLELAGQATLLPEETRLLQTALAAAPDRSSSRPAKS